MPSGSLALLKQPLTASPLIRSCTGGEATKKRGIPAQQKQGEIQVKIIALAAAVIVAAVELITSSAGGLEGDAGR